MRWLLQESAEAKRQLQDVRKHQLVELPAAAEEFLPGFWKFSQDDDHARQLEVEASQRQHSMDSAILSSAVNEIQRLKVQLEMVLKSTQPIIPANAT